jgi:poly(beta-D-mannuronate) lyase
MIKFQIGLTLLSVMASTQSVVGASYDVKNSQSLSSTLSRVQAGDTVSIATGMYSGFTVTNSGTAQAPIVIKAADLGKATISSGIIVLKDVEWVTIEGLAITTKGGSTQVDGGRRKVGVIFSAAKNCRITRCCFQLQSTDKSTEWMFLTGAADGNRIDHCEFGPNTVAGCHMIVLGGNPQIPGVVPPDDRMPWAEGQSPKNPNISRNTMIDHNYFHDQDHYTAEVIVLGGIGMTGDYQMTNSTINSNLFVNCDGDAEIISVKSSGNTIRNNTIRTSCGMLSLRAGNKNSVHDNVMLQGGKEGAGGIKIYENDHLVYNNYIDGAFEYPLLVGGGDPYAERFAHAQVHRAKIMYNTIVNVDNRPVQIGHGGPLPPSDCLFANNIIMGTARVLFKERMKPLNIVYAANVISSGKGPPEGFTTMDPGIVKMDEMMRIAESSPIRGHADKRYDPLVTTDLNGQPRGETPDVGADQYGTTGRSRPLTARDVGPKSP